MTILTDFSNMISKVPITNWQKLSNSKIYFAHMSVGYNIIDGIQDLIKLNPSIKLNIRETYNPDDYNVPVFGHSPNGNNGDPKSKIDAFVNKIEAGLGKRTDIAILKLCYVDVTAETDVEDVFKYYISRIDPVIKKYPEIAFIHCTVPLTTLPDRTIKQKIKDIIKSAIGRTTQKEQHINDNIKRNQFNALLKKHYNNSVIFDLSEAESTYPDSRREAFLKDGQNYYSLIGEYTGDGGHLNDAGRKWIAGKFLVFLAELK